MTSGGDRDVEPPVWRGNPLATPPSEVTTSRSARSFMSSTPAPSHAALVDLQLVTPVDWLSIIADSRLCAAVIAWKSPVKCRFMSSIGTTCAYPPPAAPPFIPKFGPSDASRMQIAAFWPIPVQAVAKAHGLVVLPSPAGVGLIAVTRISLPFGRPSSELMNACPHLGLVMP